MNGIEFVNLKDGDIVNHIPSGDAYVVTANYESDGIIMTRTLLASNPQEWEKVV